MRPGNRQTDQERSQRSEERAPGAPPSRCHECLGLRCARQAQSRKNRVPATIGGAPGPLIVRTTHSGRSRLNEVIVLTKAEAPPPWSGAGLQSSGRGGRLYG